MKLDEFLSGRHVAFERLQHDRAFTANRVAQLLHVKGKEMAKTVLLRTGHGYALAVLPASYWVDLDRAGRDLGEDFVGLAAESDMERLFPDCERGAMPPFGSMYDLPTIVDDSLSEDEEIVFEGQDHEEAIRMSYRDYVEVEHPKIGHFACHS
jgi:Ala-tRNA(Pro) deacylase